MKTILIIAYECAPYNRPGSTVGAQRPYQFAKNLPAFGWNSIVLCSDFRSRYSLNPESNWKKDIDHIVNEELSSWDQKKSITISLPSLSCADAIDRVWLGTVNRDNTIGTFTAKQGVLNFLKRKTASFLKLFRGDHSQSWQPVAIVAASKILSTYKIDFIMAEHGPDASIFVCRKLYSLFNVPWCVDFRDPVLRFYDGYYRPLMKMVYRYYLKRCSFLMAVHSHWATLDKHDFNKPTFVITNGFDSDEFRFANPSQQKVNEPILRLFYGGNIDFRYQSLDVLFQAFQLLSGNNSVIEFTYIGNAFSRVASMAETYKLGSRVRALPFIPRDQYLEMVSSADLVVLLSFMDKKNRFFERGLYPGKVFEYFGMQKPIVCIPGDHGILDDLILEVNAGSAYADPEELASYLLQMLKYKTEGKTLPYTPTQARHNYSREAQTKNLAAHLNNYS